MYAFIRGKLICCSDSSCVLDVSGIGFRLLMPCRSLVKFPSLGQEVLLHSSFVVRELSQTLYGFFSEMQRDLFEQLIAITGVGPKLALSIIGHMEVEELHAAIYQNSTSAFCKIPGIGKKTAERLLIELKGKLDFTLNSNLLSSSNSTLPHLISDAVSALINLGYTQVHARKAIESSLSEEDKPLELAELITKALERL